ncbi:uncharacterized protein PgNI_04850 [Pyricularia grisea]|uniref:Uncharacterized protein n=1 Tax=Pyricularia grisea TaxID=148305 RepID=A0A6P8BAG3_PYRGI|nr:uncharacterized protein PgNI_04850 [Pyricularia grisea]TLD12821.1 hypothetical protein PgNI_04850 [Pyricularia grisea]
MGRKAILVNAPDAGDISLGRLVVLVNRGPVVFEHEVPTIVYHDGIPIDVLVGGSPPRDFCRIQLAGLRLLGEVVGAGEFIILCERGPLAHVFRLLLHLYRVVGELCADDVDRILRVGRLPKHGVLVLVVQAPDVANLVRHGADEARPALHGAQVRVDVHLGPNVVGGCVDRLDAQGGVAGRGLDSRLLVVGSDAHDEDLVAVLVPGAGRARVRHLRVLVHARGEPGRLPHVGCLDKVRVQVASGRLGLVAVLDGLVWPWFGVAKVGVDGQVALLDGEVAPDQSILDSVPGRVGLDHHVAFVDVPELRLPGCASALNGMHSREDREEDGVRCEQHAFC